MMMELGVQDYFLTISTESLEYWDLAKKVRLGVFYTHFGENLLGICLT